MSRLILRLLLCLALVFNGVAAPWAQAHMRHGEHAPSPMPEGHHAHHAMAAHADEQPAANGDMDCCESGACQCGCVLAHALPAASATQPPLRFTAAPAPTARALALVHRDTPPFRPPAA
jgi:hypothetical protein